MRWSNFFIPTLREVPADAEVISHRLLLRAGMVRQLAAGIYSYLPLSWLVMRRIMQIVREEMDAVGGQEFLFPVLNPRELWEETGRWAVMGDNMFRLKDRKGADLCLGMTHEEAFTNIARHELRSYKQLPQIWYQIQSKFRDEARPKSGLLRVRQFIMKDAYSFDVDSNGLDKSFADQREAYIKIFTRCGLKFAIVEASSGAMGGSASSEFMVSTEAGEDLIATCDACGYAANLEKATFKFDAIVNAPSPLTAPEEFPTPGVRTIEDLINFPGGAPAKQQIKSLVYIVDKLTVDAHGVGSTPQPVLALMRGDHQLNETKLSDSLGGFLKDAVSILGVRPANPDEVRELLGASPGSLGGVGAKEKSKGRTIEVRDVQTRQVVRTEPMPELVIVADHALKGRSNMSTGANKDDHHLRGVNIERDIPVDLWTDLRMVQSGERCSNCETGTLAVSKSLEVGHIFKLGTKYSKSMGATVLDQNGKEVPILMGSYGIGIERIMAAAIELHHDADGIVWPRSIAPFDVVVTITNIKQPELKEAGEQLYRELRAAGLEVLLDDRDERAGVKFKDADLIGIPYRVTVGKKTTEGTVELFDRAAKQSTDVSLADVAARVQRLALANS